MDSGMKRKALIAAVLLVTGASCLRADLTREEAVEIMLKLVTPETLTRDLDSYLTAAPLVAGDVVTPFVEDERARTLTKATWFGWIDDNPDAFFTHKVRYVYIDATTGATEVIVQEWFPMVNEENPWGDEEVAADPSLLVFTSRNGDPDLEPDPDPEPEEGEEQP